MRRATTKQIERCLEAARNQGLEVASFEVTAEGSVRLTTASKYKPDPFEEWERSNERSYNQKKAV